MPDIRPPFLAELQLAVPLKPETFKALNASVQGITMRADATPLLLDDDPLYEDVEGGSSKDHIGGSWSRAAYSHAGGDEEAIKILSYNELGRELIATAVDEDITRHGALAGQIIFRKVAADGLFSGSAKLFPRNDSVIMSVEWELEQYAGQTYRGIRQFARQLGLQSLWRIYADNTANRDTRMHGKFFVAQKLGKTISLALQKLQSTE